MTDGKFVTYLRVSTSEQGESGLGLEAQRAAVEARLNGGDWKIVREVVEVESGKKNDRPALVKALRYCRMHDATLLVAKLDRLSRNVAFIANLRESKVKLAIADMPEIDETHLNMLAVFAQHEARAISSRTKAALAATKARGTVLGGRRGTAEEWADIAATGRSASIVKRSKAADAYAEDVRTEVDEIRTKLTEEGKAASSRAIAARLNDEGIRTPRGGKWSSVQVLRVIKRSKDDWVSQIQAQRQPNPTFKQPRIRPGLSFVHFLEKGLENWNLTCWFSGFLEQQQTVLGNPFEVLSRNLKGFPIHHRGYYPSFPFVGCTLLVDY